MTATISLLVAFLSLLACCIGQDDAPSFSSTSLEDGMQTNSRCEPITTQFCANIEYNQTIMPNLFDHQKQADAASVLYSYTILLKSKCSPDLQFFLCSLYIPICTVLDYPIKPCRSLCLSVKNGCERLMNSFQFKWPAALDCDTFPNPDPAICVGKNGSTTSPKTENGLTGETFSEDANLDAYKKKNNDRHYSSNSLDTFYPVGGKDFAFTCPDHFKVPKGYSDTLKVGITVAKNCGMPCDGMFFSKEERHFSKIWIGGWSIVCAVSCLFTALTFAINTNRFRYPERPIIFLALCYVVVSLVYVLGFVLEDGVACRQPLKPPYDKPRLQTVSTIAQGTKGEMCTIFFIALYFFNMASSIWWVVLTLTWFLAAGLKWGHEAIEANSQYFHLAAWGVPAIKTITILAMGKVEGDVMAGVCYVGVWNADMQKAFVLVPLIIYLALGVIFLTLGLVSLFRIRTAMMRDGTKTDKLEKLMIRIGIFSVLYAVPAVVVISCLIYEQVNFEHWMTSWHRRICQNNGPNAAYLIRCPANTGAPDTNPNFAVFMIKYSMSLVVGITSSFWIWSGKTVSNWKELFYRVKNQQPLHHQQHKQATV